MLAFVIPRDTIRPSRSASISPQWPWTSSISLDNGLERSLGGNRLDNASPKNASSVRAWRLCDLASASMDDAMDDAVPLGILQVARIALRRL